MISLKEIILDKISEIEIFERYLGTNIKLGKAMVSPLRDEKHASFNIYQNENGNIYYKDFGDERGDCFKFVMEMYNCSFPDALKLIADDFGIKKSDRKNLLKRSKKLKIPSIYVNPRKKLPYARLEWNDQLLNLWTEGGISLEILKEYNVWPVEKIKIKKNNDEYFVLESKPKDPIYCFDYGKGVKKFYRPNAINKKYKFLSNLRKGDIFGLKQIIEDNKLKDKIQDVVIICAGQKDCLSLFGNTGVRGIALNSESSGISNDIFIELMKHTNNLLVCYDNDETGIKHSNKIKEEMGISSIDIGRIDHHSNNINDIYDFFKKERLHHGKIRFLNHVYEKINEKVC